MRKQLLFFIIAMLSTSIVANAQWFVAPGGTGDGTSWDSPAGSPLTVANSAGFQDGQIIYMKAGNYTDAFNGTNNPSGTSNLPTNKKVVIQGGYPSAASGIETCDASSGGYNPGQNKTIIGTADGSNLLLGNSIFALDNTNMKGLVVKNIYFKNLTSSKSTILTLDGANNLNITFDGCYILDNIVTTNQVGILHIEDGDNNNITFSRIFAERNNGSVVTTRLTSTKSNTINITDGYFSKNQDDWGAVIWIRADANNPNVLNITNSTFCENRTTEGSGHRGGAIAIENNSIANVQNSRFYNNRARSEGGAIYVNKGGKLHSSGNTYVGNIAEGVVRSDPTEANKPAGGGAIYLLEGELKSTNDIFAYNDALVGAGGAILASKEPALNDGDPDFIIKSSYFTENKCDKSGAGIFIMGTWTNHRILILENEFCNNRSTIDGGAWAIDNSTWTDTNVYAKKNTYIGNFAASNGGAVLIKSNGRKPGDDKDDLGNIIAYDEPFVFEDEYFYENSIPKGAYGGAVYLSRKSSTNNKTFLLKNSSFKYNTAAKGNIAPHYGFGGAIAMGGVGEPAQIEECEFEGNEANDGGAIYVHSTSSALYVLRSTFKANKAYDSGGAIHDKGGGGNTTYKASNNTAGSFIVEECEFLENIAGTEDFNSNGSSDGLDGGFGGGAIYNVDEGGNKIYIYNSKFHNNKATTKNLSGTTGGGAILVGDDATIHNSEFYNNTVESYSGTNTTSTANNRGSSDGGSDLQTTDSEDDYTSSGCILQMVDSQYSGYGWTESADNPNSYNYNANGTAIIIPSIPVKSCTYADFSQACPATTFEDIVARDTNCDGQEDDPKDTDNDSVADYLDADTDNDGIPDGLEIGDDPSNPTDTDGDGVPDYKDLDSDNDGVSDAVEAGNGSLDTNGDGVIDSNDTGFTDANGDGQDDRITITSASDLPSSDGTTPDGYSAPPADAPTFVDSDGDGIEDRYDFSPRDHGSAQGGTDYGDNSAFGQLGAVNSAATDSIPDATPAVWAGEKVSYEAGTTGNAAAAIDEHDDGFSFDNANPVSGTDQNVTIILNSNGATTVYYALRVKWSNGTETLIEGSKEIVTALSGVTTAGNQTTETLILSVPADATFADIRLVSATSKLDAVKETGTIINGEVEDYNVTFGVLPVELASFTATALNSTAQLDWITASELDNSHFEVQRSTNGLDFETIGTVAGHGTTSEKQYYRFIDEKPLVGYNYYRLKQVDLDGVFEYSAIKYVRFGEALEAQLEVYPNPTSAENGVTIMSVRAGEINIFDARGSLVKQIHVDGNTLYTLDTSDLHRGIYTITGAKRKVVKLIIH